MKNKNIILSLVETLYRLNKTTEEENTYFLSLIDSNPEKAEQEIKERFKNTGMIRLMDRQRSQIQKEKI